MLGRAGESAREPRDGSAAGAAATDVGPTAPRHDAAAEAAFGARVPPLLPGGVSAHASEAAEALSQHVRATAARMSAALDTMARLLAPTAVPLALAVLCAQCDSAPACCACVCAVRTSPRQVHGRPCRLERSGG